MYHKRSLDIEHIAGYTESKIILLFPSLQTYNNTVKIKHRKVHKIYLIFIILLLRLEMLSWNKILL